MIPWYIAFAPLMVIFIIAYPFGCWWSWRHNKKRRAQYARRKGKR